MNIQTQGPKRPRLSLPFGRTRPAQTGCGAPILSGQELRRIVSEMLG
jgi:hypothetical protein